MKTETITINNKEFTKITAEAGFTFQRKHDQFLFGIEIILGLDFSTGVQRVDLPEYYEEILITNPQTTIEERIAEIEETQNDMLTVLNERGLL